MNQQIVSLLDAAALRYGVDPALVRAVAYVESRGEPDAVNKASGAAGVMQLIPATAKALGVKNALDPVENIDAGVRMLANLVRRFGDNSRALFAYNMGPGRLSRGAAVPSTVKQYALNIAARRAVEGGSEASALHAARSANPAKKSLLPSLSASASSLRESLSEERADVLVLRAELSAVTVALDECRATALELRSQLESVTVERDQLKRDLEAYGDTQPESTAS